MSGGADGASRTARVGVAVPAAGSGQRMGGVRKVFLEIEGKPVLEHALRPFLAHPHVVAVAVALAEDQASDPPGWLARLDPRVVVVPGGATRTRSVRAALAALPSDLDAIAVHDAARPLVEADAVGRCIEIALGGEGAVAGCPAVDTLKRVDRAGRVTETPDRSAFWLAQTPQVFPAAALRDAYADPGQEGTDDATLVERRHPDFVIRMVDAGPSNVKVTRPADVAVAEAILGARRDPSAT